MVQPDTGAPLVEYDDSQRGPVNVEMEPQRHIATLVRELCQRIGEGGRFKRQLEMAEREAADAKEVIATLQSKLDESEREGRLLAQAVGARRYGVLPGQVQMARRGT